MMMPANYSAIAENEMTYVVGGGAVIDFLGTFTAPVWTIDNLKTFNTNVVTMIGNKYTTALVNNTLGTVFRGYTYNSTWEGIKSGVKTVFGYNKEYGVGTYIANLIGTGAAIYNMGRSSVSISLPTTTYTTSSVTYSYDANGKLTGYEVG